MRRPARARERPQNPYGHVGPPRPTPGVGARAYVDPAAHADRHLCSGPMRRCAGRVVRGYVKSPQAGAATCRTGGGPVRHDGQQARLGGSRSESARVRRHNASPWPVAVRDVGRARSCSTVRWCAAGFARGPLGPRQGRREGEIGCANTARRRMLTGRDRRLYSRRALRAPRIVPRGDIATRGRPGGQALQFGRPRARRRGRHDIRSWRQRCADPRRSGDEQAAPSTASSCTQGPGRLPTGMPGSAS